MYIVSKFEMLEINIEKLHMLHALRSIDRLLFQPCITLCHSNECLAGSHIVRNKNVCGNCKKKLQWPWWQWRRRWETQTEIETGKWGVSCMKDILIWGYFYTLLTVAIYSILCNSFQTKEGVCNCRFGTSCSQERISKVGRSSSEKGKRSASTKGKSSCQERTEKEE